MRLVLVIKFWLGKFRSFKKMFETTCLSEVVAHWRFCLIDSKSLGYLCCGFERRSMKRIKRCCKLHFFLKGYSHDNWMAFILERVHVISNKWTFYFRTSHCGFQCKWMFSMLLAPFCFMLSSLHSFWNLPLYKTA